MERIIHALRARRLDAVAVGYAVVGWVLVQAADIVLPTFAAPPWVLRALIIFLAIGFPVALVTAWFAVPHIFEPTTAGGRRARNYALLAVFVGVIALIAADFAYLLSNAAVATAPPAATAPGRAQAGAPAKNSIAVLPFDNMSGDPSKAYFSDGISEELLNDLANIPALKVAARTSSFAFKGKDESVRTIAHALGVRSILEGSVRASGRHLRITATLIDAQHGYTLWSKTYDRDLTDVLIVQSEIARAITAALTDKLLPAAAQRAKPHPIDPEAYRAYLRGKYALAPRTQAGAAQAIGLFRKAVALAPDFAGAYAALARAQITVAEEDLSRRDLIADAHAALKRALELDPRNLDALSSHLDLSLHELDWRAAIDDANRMQAINPNSADVLHELFRFYLFLGFPDHALDAAEGAAELDPLSFVDRLNVTAGLLHNGRYGQALDAARAAQDLSPDQPYLLSLLCNAAARHGDLETARRTEATLAAAGKGARTSLAFCRFQIAVAGGRKAEAKTITDRLAAAFGHGGPSATALGENYAIVGDHADAVRWLTRAYDRKEFLLFVFPRETVVPAAFFETPGWKALYARPLFADWRKAHARVATQLAGG